MGRQALINDEQIRDVAHLDLLSQREREVVEIRWGLATGNKVTQREAARILKIRLEDLRAVEQRAALKIQRHIESQPSSPSELTELKRRVGELEEIVNALDAILPYVKTARRPVKRRPVKS